MPPANTLVRWVDEIAFASVVQARPCPTFGRPVRHGVAPSTTARYCSANPSDPTSRWAPCPPQFRRGGSRSTLAVSSFRLRARVGVSIPATCGRRGITPAFGYGPPHPGAGGTSTLLTSALPGAQYGLLRHPGRPDLALTGVGWRVPRHRQGFPCCLFHACCRHYPGGAGRCLCRSLPGPWQPSPSNRRVGFRIIGFEACTAFRILRPAWSRSRPWQPFSIEVLQTMSLPPSSAPTVTGWSDGVDASPGRHRNVPRWMCRDTTHLKEEASSGTRYHHRDRLGEAQFSAPWRTGRRVGCVPQEAEPEQGAGFRGVAAALCRGDGGLREFTPLGPRDRKARSCGEARPTDLREAVREAAEERRGRRGGDLRSGVAPDDALRGGEDAGAAGSGHAVPHARAAGSAAHADDQRAAGALGGVRRCRSAGTGLCRAAGGGNRRRRLGAAGPGPRAGGAVARSGRRSRREDRGAGARAS